MKKTVKVLATLLILVIFCTMFGACGKKDEGGEETSDGALSTADISFVDSDGEAAYRIIRPSNSTDAESAAAVSIFKEYKTKHNVSPKNQTDDEPSGGPEILIGNTNREETKKALELLDSQTAGRRNEYIVCSINDDIVIYGRSDEALEQAAKVFLNDYLVNSTVTGGINNIFQSEEGYAALSLFGSSNLSEVTIVRPIYNVSYVTQLEIDKLISSVSDRFGYVIPLVNDQSTTDTGDSLSGRATLENTEDKDYEIIIGNCVRDGVNKNLDKDEYEIRIEDKNIYLNGGSSKATAMAVTEFLGILESKNEITSAHSVASGNYNDVINKYDSASYYRLTWSDDFDGTEINTKLWDVRWGESAYKAPEGEKSTYRGNKELKNNYVKDGNLYIVATETDTARYGGLLTTQGMMEYYMGYIEISTLHPRCEGVWTALYTMSAVSRTDKNNVWAWLNKNGDTRMYYNETDVEECYGAGNWVYQNSFAWPTEYGRTQLGLLPEQSGAVHVNNNVVSDDRGFWMDFHTYGFELLDSNRITYTVDGKVSFVQELTRGEEKHAYDQPVFLRLAMAAGTANHAISSNKEYWDKYGTYIVDYVHVYQHKGNKLYTKQLNDTNWKTYVVE